jgi:hypothetical protein
VIDCGVKVAVTPGGTPEIDREIEPGNAPFCALAVMT